MGARQPQEGHCRALSFGSLERRKMMINAISPPPPKFSHSFPVWTFMAENRAKHRARFDRPRTSQDTVPLSPLQRNKTETQICPFLSGVAGFGGFLLRGNSEKIGGFCHCFPPRPSSPAVLAAN